MSEDTAIIKGLIIILIIIFLILAVFEIKRINKNYL